MTLSFIEPRLIFHPKILGKKEATMTQTPQQHFDAVASIMQDVKFAMLTTITAEGHLHACPMTTNHINLPAREIWFIGDKTTETVKDIQNNAQVNLSYTSKDHKDYVSINGHAELVDDADKLDELWSPMYSAFFEHGKEDVNVQLIKVVPNGAEYWLSGSDVVNFFKMTAAAVTGGKIADSLGENSAFSF